MTIAKGDNKLGRVAVYLGAGLKKRLEDYRRKKAPIPSESAIVKEAVEKFLDKRGF